MASSANLPAVALILGLSVSLAWATLHGLSVDPDFHRVLAVREGVGNEWNTSSSTALNVSASSERVLSRARRYVVFPKGSSLQLVYCVSLHGYVPLTSHFVVGMTMGLAWMLPSEPRQLYLQRRDTSRHPDREHRLKLYQDMGTFLTSQGLRGQQCVQRTICESTRPKDQNGNFMEELSRVFFSLPATDFPENSDWDEARYNGKSCSVRFPQCTSIIDLPIKPIK